MIAQGLSALWTVTMFSQKRGSKPQDKKNLVQLVNWQRNLLGADMQRIIGFWGLKMRDLTKWFLFLLLSMNAFHPTIAQNIIGPTKIISYSSDIIGGDSTLPLSNMFDGITSNSPFNGFVGQNNITGNISITFDQTYDLDQSYLWNDINIVAEGVKTYQLKYFDSSNNLISTSAVFSTNIGQVPAHIQQISVVDVKRVEFIVLSIRQSIPTRVEIREVAFNGTPSLPPVDVAGDHFQCYRVIQGKALTPSKIKVADQFGRTEIVLGMPVLLCNPAAKFHNGKMFEPASPQLHQLCYKIINRPNPKRSHKVRVSNQFTTKEMTVATRDIFCAPSTKILLNETPYNLSDFTENP